MSAETERIHPPVLYGTVWWAVAAICLLAAVVVVVVALRARRPQAGPVAWDVESLRETTLARIRHLVEEASTQSGGEVARRTAEGVSREVRRFLGTVSGHDLDFTTRAEWSKAAERDPRLGDAVVLLEDLQDLVFRPVGEIDVDALGRRAMEVVTQWR